METINNSQLNSLRSIPEFFGGDNKTLVVIPKVQRAYAQGRTNEKNLREQFVNELFDAMESETVLELNFIYGSKTKNDGNDKFRFELLDGQQRITTLTLLYWYIACAEKHDIPNFIKSFTYETRTTSSNFLKEISKSFIEIGLELPSKIIRSRQWYTVSFDKDSSVNGMMNMLDAIHNRYICSSGKGNLFTKLDYLKFYELDLEDFGLTEEIYVKMNARGLQLTPFENFKADIIKFMKQDDMSQFHKTVEMDIVGKPKVPYYLNFSQKLDNKWLNIFWDKEHNDGREYCARYFRFFYHFFASKLFLEKQKSLRAQDYRPKSEDNPIWDFFWRLSPEQDKTYIGFNFYKEMLQERSDYINSIEHILDWFSKPETKSLIDEELVEPWNKENKWLLFDKRYRLSDAVIFTAICEYIERSKDGFYIHNFRRWMRIVRNAVADQLMRNVNEYISLSRSLVSLLEQPEATKDIYSAIAYLKIPENTARSIRETIEKARIIIEHPDDDWETIFINAEAHPMFEGSIAFMLYNLPNSSSKFAHRANLLGQLFDSTGMTEDSRKEHRLIRILARQLNTREALISAQPTILTERKDKENHLRSFLLEKKSVGEFLCKLGDMADIDTIFQYIDSHVNVVPDIQMEAPLLFSDEDFRLKRAYQRICLDPRIYDFISDIEIRKNRSVIFMERNGNYTVDYKNSWYDRIYIGTDRIFAIKKALSLGYEFFSDTALENIETYGDIKDDITYYNDTSYYGIWMSKDLGSEHYLEIVIKHDGTVYFCVEAEDSDICELFPDKIQYGEDDYIIAEISVEDRNQLGAFTRKLNGLEKKIKEELYLINQD
ncbi:MAG: DUF262 domain-containing protein [Bacteroidales bacterium]|nr:DUF262 domain-containing protein [Bacteroidales bacterium]